MNRKLILVLALTAVLCTTFHVTRAQTPFPYKISWKKDGMFLGGGLLLFGIDHYLTGKMDPLTPVEINKLDANDINSFDRSATENWSEAASHRSDVGIILSAASTALTPALFPVVSKKNDNDFGNQALTLGMIWLEANLITYSGTNIVKASFQRVRPYAYNPVVDMKKKQEVDTKKSFFSGHTSLTAANSYLFAKMFSDVFPESRFKPLVWGLAVALPAWTATERYLAGKHYPTDVIAGYVFGAGVGYLVPHFHKAGSPSKNLSYQFLPVYGSGYSGFVFNLSF